ncbi:MAG: hypothetical protein IKZ51_04520 [Bacteroidales bacterium]|nr:hypothetical protein [Bacteroidales bacterium]
MRRLLVALAVLLSAAGYAQDIATRHICSIDRRYPNDGDCFGDLFFQFHSQNQEPEGDFHGVSVANLKSGKTLAFTDLGFNENFHNSSLTFVRRKACLFDRLPLLYASENYAPNEYYKIHVYRIKRSGDAFSFDIVQTIEMPSPDSLGILYPHAIPDEDGKHLWIEGYSQDKKRTVFMLFDLPAFKSGSTVSMGEPLRRFDIKRKKVTDQAYCMRNGKFYQVVGVKREAWLRVVDIATGTLEREVLFNDHDLPHEPEAVFFWHDQLCVSFSVDGRAEVYTVDLL